MFDISTLLADPLGEAASTPGPLAPLQQSELYAEAIRMAGGSCSYHLWESHGAWVIERRFPVLGRAALLSRGPDALDAELARALPERLSARHVIVNAESAEAAQALAQGGYWQIAAPREIAELDLAPDAETQRAGLRGNFRNQLRAAEGSELRVTRTPLTPTERHWIFEEDKAAGRQKGYRPMPPILVAAMAAAKPGAAQLFVARRRKTAIAAMLFLCHGQMATFQIGWSNTEGRALRANNLLMWTAMTALPKRGIRRLDLGAAGTDSPGLRHFKLGTGARVRRLGGTWLSSALLPRWRRTLSAP